MLQAIENIRRFMEIASTGVHALGQTIGEAISWIPVTSKDLTKYIIIAVVLGIVTIAYDTIFSNGKEKNKISCFYWGTLVSFVFSMIGLSLFFKQIGDIETNDIPFMLISSLAVSGIIAIEMGVASYMDFSGLIGCAVAPIYAFLLWNVVGLIALSIYYMSTGEVMYVLAFMFLAAIPGWLFGLGEEYYYIIVFERLNY